MASLASPMPGFFIQMPVKDRQTIKRNVRAGAPVNVALKQFGFTQADWQRWAALAEDMLLAEQSNEFTQWIREVQAAEGESEVTLLRSWHQMGQTSWRAAKEFLQMRWPDQYKQQDAERDSGSGGVSVRIYLPDNGRDQNVVIEGAEYRDLAETPAPAALSERKLRPSVDMPGREAHQRDNLQSDRLQGADTPSPPGNADD